MRVPESWTAQMFIAGALTFAGLWAIGYYSKASPTKQKKSRQGGNGGGMGGGGEQLSSLDLKLERIYKTAEQLFSQGNVAQAELKYIEGLDLVQDFPDPQTAAMLEGVFSHRAAVACEKQGKYEEAVKYYLRAIENYESRPLQSPHEYENYSEILEKAVNICMTKLNEPTKAIKPLTLWLKLGEEMGSEQIIAVSCNLLSNIKSKLGEYEEAEGYCKKVITLISKKGPGGVVEQQLSLGTMVDLSNIFFHLDKHEENKKLIADMSAFISAQAPAMAANIYGSFAETVFDYGYWSEALSLFQRAVEFSTRSMASFEEVAHLDNCIAETLAESGRIEEARQKLLRLATSLGDSDTVHPLTVSRYFDTRDAIVEEQDNKVVHSIKLAQHNSKSLKKKSKLPDTAVLVCSVDNPEVGQPPIVVQQPAAPTVEFNIELPFAKKGYYIAQIDVYSDDTKTNKLSTHLILSYCEADLRVPGATEAVVAESEHKQESESEPESVPVSALPSDVIQTAIFAPSSPASSPSTTHESAPINEESVTESQAESHPEPQVLETSQAEI